MSKGTEEDVSLSLSNSSLHHEKEAKGNVRMDYSALTKEDKKIKKDGSLSNMFESDVYCMNTCIYIYICMCVCIYVCMYVWMVHPYG